MSRLNRPPDNTGRRRLSYRRPAWAGVPLSSRHHRKWDARDAIGGSHRYRSAAEGRAPLLAGVAAAMARDSSVITPLTISQRALPHRPATTRLGFTRRFTGAHTGRTPTPVLPHAPGATPGPRSAGIGGGRAAAPAVTPAARAAQAGAAAAARVPKLALGGLAPRPRPPTGPATSRPRGGTGGGGGPRRPEVPSTARSLRGLAAADMRCPRYARPNAVLTFFRRAPVGGTRESENGRMAAESFFKYARPWGGQPSISYPSKTNNIGRRFVQ